MSTELKLWSMHSGARYIEGVMVEEYDGRLMSFGHPIMVEYAEYERLRAALLDISTTFAGNPKNYIAAANRAVEIAESALDVECKHG